MELEDYINEFGGKAGQLIYLQEAMPDLPIPRFVFKRNGVPFKSIQREFDKLRPPYIVRGSNRNDHFGLEGIIPSKRDLKTLDEVKEAVKKIERFGREPQLMDLYEQLYGPVSRVNHALIMEQNPSDSFLFALRSPHNRDFLQVQFDVFSPDLLKHTVAYQYNSREKTFHRNGSGEEVCIEEIGGYNLNRMWGPRVDTLGNLRYILGLIESIEASGRIFPNYAHFYEFGLDYPGLFQVRAFKPYEEPRFDFDTSGIDERQLTSLCYGQTPTEGIELPFYSNESYYNRGVRAGDAVDRGYFGLFKKGFNLSLVNAIGASLFEEEYSSMKGFVLDSSYTNFLSHDIIRLIKRSEVVLVGGAELTVLSGQPVRIISNGIKGAVLFEEFKW